MTPRPERVLSLVVKDYLNTMPLPSEERQRLLELAHTIMADANQGWPSIAEDDDQTDLNL